MIEKLTKDTLMFFATFDPIGNLALFIALTKGYSEAQRRKIAFKSIFYSFIILSTSILAGQFILKGMGIELFSLQIAGGIILFIFGLQMIFGIKDKLTENISETDHDVSVFPLAVPSISGPGAIMSVIVLTDSGVYTFHQQLATFSAMTFTLLSTFVLFLLANPIMRVIGKNGALILVKVMGMILTALSIQLILDGLGVSLPLN
jgi:multiple antibiotic resistance protein